jgi:PleD family two-component response regulator
LAIVKGLTEKLGGSVDVQSQYSKGTTFTLYFPYDEIEIEKAKLVSDNAFKRNIEKSEIESSRVRPKINKRILIVEDNDINIKVLVKRLASLGIENLEVSKNGKEAIEACEKESLTSFSWILECPSLMD